MQQDAVRKTGCLADDRRSHDRRPKTSVRPSRSRTQCGVTSTAARTSSRWSGPSGAGKTGAARMMARNSKKMADGSSRSRTGPIGFAGRRYSSNALVQAGYAGAAIREYSGFTAPIRCFRPRSTARSGVQSIRCSTLCATASSASSTSRRTRPPSFPTEHLGPAPIPAGA